MTLESVAAARDASLPGDRRTHPWQAATAGKDCERGDKHRRNSQRGSHGSFQVRLLRIDSGSMQCCSACVARIVPLSACSLSPAVAQRCRAVEYRRLRSVILAIGNKIAVALELEAFARVGGNDARFDVRGDHPLGLRVECL